MENVGGRTLTLSGPVSTTTDLIASSGTLLFSEATVTNTATTIRAEGGLVRIANSTIDGGTLLVSDDANSRIEYEGDVTLNSVDWADEGAGEFRVYSTTARLLGDERVPAGQTLVVAGYSYTQLTLSGGTFTNDGTIELRGAHLHLDSDATLAGNGQVVSASSGRIAGEAGSVLTVGADQTIRGTGSISVPVINAGLIEADVATNTLTLSGAVENTGTVRATGNAKLSIAGSFAIDGTGYLAGDSTGTIAVAEDLTGNTQNAEHFSVFPTVRFDGSGSEPAPQHLEVMARDFGPDLTGADRIFVYHSLALGNGTYLRLVDNSDNSAGNEAESLYVSHLTVPSGTTLDLNGCHVYAESTDVQGTIVGGVVDPFEGFPRIVQQTPNSGDVQSLGAVQFQFDRDMDGTTFSIMDDVVSFTGPQGAIAITAANWLDSRTMELVFDEQATAGEYRLTLGTQIADSAGKKMDQDWDYFAGELPDDQYVATFVISAPHIVSHGPASGTLPPLESVQLTFDRAMDQASFSTLDDISLMGPDGAIPAADHSWLDAQTLEIMFDPQWTIGEYQLVVQPHILDPGGNELDQDGDLVPGEEPDDQYTATFIVPFSRIESHIPNGVAVPPLESMRMMFDRPMNQATFSLADDASLIGPDGSITLADHSWLDAQTLEIMFDPQWTMGEYQLVVQPHISDLVGNELDQDGDSIPGEELDDRYMADVTVAYSGTLSADDTLTPEHGPILIDGTLTIPSGVTLTIEPGSILKFKNSAGLNVQGTLLAQGTAENRIVFTSAMDDNHGGDTNGDGPATVPSPGDWQGVMVNGGDATIRMSSIFAATSGISAMSGASASLDGCLLQGNEIGIFRGWHFVDIFVQRTVIAQNNNGVRTHGLGRETFIGSTIADNAEAGIWYDGGGNGVTLSMDSTIVSHNRLGIRSSENDTDATIRNSAFFNNEADIIWASNGNVPDLNAMGNQAADPLFMDVANGDYRLQPGSPAIDAGRGIGANATDILGRPYYDDQGMGNIGAGYPAYVDMGAFERQEDTLAMDLAVTQVSNAEPTNLQQGEDFTFTWSVQNLGEADLSGGWTDAVYLSSDPYLSSGSDRLLATFAHSGSLAVRQTYSETRTLQVPADAIGPQYILVHTNSGPEFRESMLTNNVRASQTALAVATPELELGTPQAGTISEGEWNFYRFEAESGRTVRFVLDTQAASGSIQLYVRRGTPPTVSAYDAIGAVFSQPDQEARLLNPAAESYYVGVFANRLPSGPYGYTLLAEFTVLDLGQIGPAQIGNTGSATLKITGDSFTRDSEVQLIADDSTILEATEWFQDSTTVFATFDLAGAGAAAGVYDVVVTNPGIESTTSYDALTVTQGGTAQLQTDLILPSIARPGRKIDIRIEYTNTGNVDMASPLFTVESADELAWTVSSQWDFSQMEEYRGMMLLPPELLANLEFFRIDGGPDWIPPEPVTRRVVVDSVSTLATSSDGPATILRPGESYSMTIEVMTPMSPGNIPFTLYLFGVPGGEGLSDPIDWDQINTDLQPPDISADAWDPLFARLKGQVGNTWSDYLTMLRDNADHLAEVGQRIHDPAELFSFELVQAAAMGAPFYLTTAQDAFCPAPGLPLSFNRFFMAGPTYRARLGALGRGWTHAYEISLTEQSDDSILISDPSGVDRLFQSDGAGGYIASSSDHATLTAQSEGDFLLTEMNGLTYRFRDSGLLDSIEEPNGNRVVADYNVDGQLVHIVHSNGDQLSFTYNAQGRLETITDHVDRVTAFAYDPTGEHLLSVTAPDGQITAYSYITGEGLLRDHNLTSVTYPGGVQVSYSYDAFGRLQEHHLASDAEIVSYGYSTAGKTFVTDALGNTYTMWLDSQGRTTRVENALGHSADLYYDGASNLAAVVGPTGIASQFVYDGRGNLVVTADPMGNVTEFGYSQQYGNLAWFRDARGNTTAYDYDADGNLTAITYPDESIESYVYDAAGTLDSWTNRRDDTIDYTYNERGQLTEKRFPDGMTLGYTYDEAGRLVTATDARGATSLEYDPLTDRLTRITYPEGRYLAYQYNALGQRTRMVDQDGFTTNYHYDAAGRLSQLTDSSGTNVVTYTYDAAGRLVHEDKGNGTYTTYQYDALGQVLDLTNHAPDGTPQSYFRYSYDPLGRRVGMETHFGTWTYEYDDAGQLVHAVLDSTDPQIESQDITYVYDAVGNRGRTIVNGQVTEYTTNDMNQYTQVGDAVYEYDADGNMTSKTDASGTWTYVYSADNRLIGVIGPDGDWDYEYDPLGNRIASVEDGQRTEYLVDPGGLANVVARYDAAGTLVANYMHGLGLVSQVDALGTGAYYGFDVLGSTSQLTNPAGTVVNTYAYDPFGGSLHQSETLINPFEFVGRFGVMNEANGLEFMRARFYDAVTGRFIQQDPIGILGGLNLYAYAENNPVKFIDPEGGRSRSAEELLDDLQKQGGKTQSYYDPNQAFPVVYFAFMQIGAGLAGTCLLGGAATLAIIGGSVTWPIVLIGGVGAAAIIFSVWPPNGPPTNGGNVPNTNSVDPEDKFGPAGYDQPGTLPGSEVRYVAAGQTFDYRIEFWNHPTAEVAAQDATMEDILDPNVFDLSTFEFTRVGLLGWDVPLPGGQALETRIDMRPEMNLVVDVTGTFDPDTGRVFWWFHCMDPITGEYPEDPEAGFLPPFNPETGYELGWMEYRVDPKADLPSGTRVENRAYGEFDFIGDRYNNPAPPDGPWVNTIDAAGPASQVETLPPYTNNEVLTVRWNGQDDAGGSGIAGYDILVATNDGPFEIWLDDTTDTAALFVGEFGHAYSFYSVATDNVGHREAAPVTSDAQTTINVPPTADSGGPYSVAEGGLVALDASASSDPEQTDNNTLTYEWDFDYDGLTFDVDATGMSPDFSASMIDGPATQTIGLRVTDDGDLSDTTTTTVDVTNVNPTATITGSPTTSPEGVEIVLGSSIADPAPADTTAGFSYSWNVTKDGAAYDSGTGDTFRFTPNDDGSYQVTLIATDKDGGISDPAIATIDVTNVVPTIVVEGGDTIAEGAEYTLTLGTITDPGTDTVTQWIVHWGDGATETFISGGDRTHAYVDDDPTATTVDAYAIRVDLVDEDDTHLNVGSKGITVTNVAPGVEIVGAPGSSPEGTEISLSAEVTDPGSDSFTYSWAVTKDGSSYDMGTEQTFGFTPDDNGSYVVSLTVTDDDTGAGTATPVTLLVRNMVPMINVEGGNAITEGAEYTLTLGEITDPGDDTVTEWIVHWGDGATDTYDNGGPKTHTYTDNESNGTADGPYTIAVDLIDEDGTHAGADNKEITVNNVAPAVNAGEDATLDEGSLFTGLGSFTDPGADTWTATVDYGDGSGALPFTLNADKTFDLSHIYADDGDYTVTVTVEDDDAGSGGDTLLVTVNNVAPVLDAIGNKPVDEQTELVFTATADDHGLPADTLTFSLDDDAIAMGMSITAAGAFFWTPTEAQGGASYNATITVSDGSLSDSETISITVVEVNLAPVLDAIGNKSVEEQTALTFTATASDQDLPADTMVFSLDAAAVALRMSITADGEFSWTPTEAHGGASYDATITATDNGMPNMDHSETISITVNAIVPKVVDLGQVDFRLLENLSLAGSRFYRIKTVNDGMLSLQIDVPAPPKSARLKLYDADPLAMTGLTPLALSALDEDANQRIDLAVAVGETYYVEVYGSNDDFDLRIANLVQHVGTTVTVHGTDENDVFEFAPTGSYLVTINGVAYHFDDAEVDLVQFDGSEGKDTASIEDSSGNDVYTATPDYAQIVAPDFTVRAESCSEVHAYARHGGTDTAIFIDSPGNDKAKAEDGDTVKMYSSNRSYYNRAKFFETVQVNFSEGGTKADARLWDSPASDIFDGMPGNCRFYSEDTAFDVTVVGADFVTVRTENGGDDKLILHDSPNDDIFRAKPHKVEMLDRDTGGEIYKIIARGFKDIAAYADQGGRDIAKLYDSTLDDLWEAEYREGDTWSKMASANRDLYEAIAFEQVKGYSLNGGTNTLRKRIVPPEVDFVLTHGDWEEAI